MRFFLYTAIIAATLTSSGCGTFVASQQIKTDFADMTNTANTLQQAATQRAKNYSAQAIQQQDVDEPWLAGKSVPLSREVALPAVLRTRLRLKGETLDALGQTKITALTPECNPSNYTLQRLASCITALVGIPVRIKPEALLPASQFALRRGAGGGGGAPAAGAVGGGASQVDLLTIPPVDIELNALLDLADATWGVNHRLTDTGTIEIYRLESRVLRLKALAQRIPSSVTSSAGFKDESKTTYENTAVDVLASIKTSLTALSTQAGTIDINLDTKSVVVVDTPEAIARIEAYLESENKRLTRRITLIFEELYVTNVQGREAAIDWNLLYTRTSGTQGSWVSPGTVVSKNVASTGFDVASSGKYAGSTGFIQALSEMGLMVNRRTFPISTLSGNAQTIGLPTVFDYVASVTSNSGSSPVLGAYTAPTVTQKEDKYGVFLTVTPEAQDDGQILIGLNLADRSGTLTGYTVQVNGNGTTVQQRNIKEANLTARTVVRSGVTHLVGGLDEALNTASARRVDENAPIVLGGSDLTSQTTRRIVLLVTAIAEDSI